MSLGATSRLSGRIQAFRIGKPNVAIGPILAIATLLKCSPFSCFTEQWLRWPSAASPFHHPLRWQLIATRVARFEAAIIPHMMHNNALTALEEDLLNTSAGRSAKARLICGNAGSGKSTLLSAFLSRHPDFETRDGTRRKIVLVELPEATTKKALVKAICTAIGYPAHSRMTTNDLIDDIADKVERLGVAMIILDEAHHMLVQRELEPTTEFLKSLLNRVKCQVTLVGLPRITILKEFEQLNRRLLPDIPLKPYDWAALAGKIEFLKLLYHFEQNMGLDKPSNLAHPEIAARIYVACKGHIGIVSKFLAEGLKRALENRLPSLSLPILAEVHACWHPPVDPPRVIDFFAELDCPDDATINDIGTAQQIFIDPETNPFACAKDRLNEIWATTMQYSENNCIPAARSRRPRGSGADKPRVL